LQLLIPRFAKRAGQLATNIGAGAQMQRMACSNQEYPQTHTRLVKSNFPPFRAMSTRFRTVAFSSPVDISLSSCPSESARRAPDFNELWEPARETGVLFAAEADIFSGQVSNPSAKIVSNCTFRARCSLTSTRTTLHVVTRVRSSSCGLLCGTVPETCPPKVRTLQASVRKEVPDLRFGPSDTNSLPDRRQRAFSSLPTFRSN
jgi:hypothetical protein